MRISRLILENFRGFERLELPFAANNITVLIGENGSGKSSVLGALAVVLDHMAARIGGVRVPVVLVRQDVRLGAPSLRIAVEVSAGNAHGACSLAFPPRDSNLDFGEGGFRRELADLIRGGWYAILCLYTPHRVLRSASPGSDSTPARRGQAHEGAFDAGDRNFVPLLTWWREEEDRENEIRLNDDAEYRSPMLEVVRLGLARFLARLPGADFARVRFTRVGVDVPKAGMMVLEKRGTTLRLDQLSDGENTLLLMVADIARRLALASRGADASLEGSGVVLIDEIDLHLHPKWQRAVLPALRAAFPNLQFIATTHSPQVLGNLHRDSVVLLEDFRIVTDTPPTFGRDSTSILSDLMGLPERNEQAQALIDDVARLIDEERLDEALARLRDLEAWVGPHDPAVVQSRSTIAFLEHDEEHP